MLANMELVNCYNSTGMDGEVRDRVMLESAKENLLRMAFFGLTELQAESQYIFQETFNLRFKVKFNQYNEDYPSKKYHDHPTDGQVKKIQRLNHLDVKLYKFAREVMMRRFEFIKRRDPDFEGTFGDMARGDSS